MIRHTLLGRVLIAGVAASWCVIAHAAPPAFHNAVAADGPILWYRFNEAPGSTTAINYGSLGAGFNGVYRNGAAPGAASLGGDTACAFNAPNQQYVESLTTAPASLTGNPTFTAEAIVYVNRNGNNSNAGYPPFLHWGAPATGRSVYFSLHHQGETKAYAGFYNGGLRMQCDFSDNEWHHLVWVRQGGATQWTGTTLYVDGRAVAMERDTVLIGAPTINVTSTTFTVQRATDFARYFSGRIDEVVLYDRMLSAEEVLEHFNALSYIPFRCIADVDDGTGTGTPDCGITIDDLLFFLGVFETGLLAADVDDGSGTGTPDGGVTIDDLLYYLVRFEAGC
jgi:hypothetical protein